MPCHVDAPRASRNIETVDCRCYRDRAPRHTLSFILEYSSGWLQRRSLSHHQHHNHYHYHGASNDLQPSHHSHVTYLHHRSCCRASYKSTTDRSAAIYISPTFTSFCLFSTVHSTISQRQNTAVRVAYPEISSHLVSAILSAPAA